MRVVIEIKDATDKSLKDRNWEPVHWRSHIISLEQSQPQAGGCTCN